MATTDFKRRLGRIEKRLKPKNNRRWYQHSPLVSVAIGLETDHNINIDIITNDEFFSIFSIDPWPVYVAKGETDYKDNERVEAALVEYCRGHGLVDMKEKDAWWYAAKIIAHYVNGEKPNDRNQNTVVETRAASESERTGEGGISFFLNGELSDAEGKPFPDGTEFNKKLVILPLKSDSETPEDLPLSQDGILPEVGDSPQSDDSESDPPKGVPKKREPTENELKERAIAMQEIHNEIRNFSVQSIKGE